MEIHPLKEIWNQEWRKYIEEQKLWVLTKLGNELHDFLLESNIIDSYFDETFESHRGENYIIGNNDISIQICPKDWAPSAFVTFPFEEDESTKQSFAELVKKFPLHMYKMQTRKNIDSAYAALRYLKAHVFKLEDHSDYNQEARMSLHKYKNKENGQEIYVFSKEERDKAVRNILNNRIKSYTSKHALDNWMTVEQAAFISNTTEDFIRSEFKVTPVSSMFRNEPIDKLSSDSAERFFETYDKDEYIEREIRNKGEAKIILGEYFPIKETIMDGFYLYEIIRHS